MKIDQVEFWVFIDKALLFQTAPVFVFAFYCGVQVLGR